MLSAEGPRDARSATSSLPVGTVSLVFTDIEGSTVHLRQLRGAYGRLLADHAELLRAAAIARGGHEVDTQGDAFFFAFPRAVDAVAAAGDLQRSTAAHAWPSGVDLRVRVGVHTGEPQVVDGRYVGLDVHRAARICAAARGGQVLLSQTTVSLVADELPAEIALREVGTVRLKGFDRPERLTQLEISGLPTRFPAPGDADRPDEPDADPAIAIASQRVSTSRSDFDLLLLGPVTACRAGSALPVTAPKHRMILATLGLRFGEAVSTDVLLDTLWGNRPPPTANKALQVYVSELRKLIEIEPREPAILTSSPPGYRLSVGREAVDLSRFERLWLAGRDALAGGDPTAARELLGQALALWRGDPLADFRFEDAFAGDIRRLEELRLGCLEDRFDADLAVGEHSRVVPEIEAKVALFPLRERLRGQLMLALYRSGRQADALAAYQSAREQLVDQLGIDPSSELVSLERQILQQDPALAAPATDCPPALRAAAPTRTLLVVSQSSKDVEALCALAETITTSSQNRSLVLARVVATLPDKDPTPHLREVTRMLVERRDVLLERGLRIRVAAFASRDPAADLVKLAEHQDADLLIVDGSQTLVEGRFGAIDTLLHDASCDVGLHLNRPDGDATGPIVVPFSGSEHDWAALELAAVLAGGGRRPLVLAGVDSTEAGSDASRLLATASLIIQRIGDVIPEPVLVPPGADGILGVAAGSHILTGLSARFREEGLGEARFRLAREAPGPVTFVRRGTRPGVLAPPESVTRFTWSLPAR
jgi:DNA-binding SARP family transcriptional activator/class 3 adenylate cyclase